MCDEAVVDTGKGDDALDADAVLARGLEGAAQEYAGDFLEVPYIVQDDGCVFAAELDCAGRQASSRGRDDFVRDGAAADEGEVGEARVRG